MCKNALKLGFSLLLIAACAHQLDETGDKDDAKAEIKSEAKAEKQDALEQTGLEGSTGDSLGTPSATTNTGDLNSNFDETALPAVTNETLAVDDTPKPHHKRHAKSHGLVAPPSPVFPQDVATANTTPEPPPPPPQQMPPPPQPQMAPQSVMPPVVNAPPINRVRQNASTPSRSNLLWIVPIALLAPIAVVGYAINRRRRAFISDANPEKLRRVA